MAAPPCRASASITAASDNIYVPGLTKAAIDFGSGVLLTIARFTGAGAVTYAIFLVQLAP